METAQNGSLSDTATMTAELVRSCLKKESSGERVEAWIYWNNSPSRHIPKKTLDTLLPEQLQQSLSNGRVRRSIDDILMAKLAWKEEVAWNPHDALLDISLLNPLQFERLVLLGAALQMRTSLAQIIEGSVIRELYQAIGKDIFEYVLLSHLSFPKIQLLEKETSQNIVTLLQQKAVCLVEYAFSTREKAIQVRIASKLPGAFATNWKQPPAEESQQAEQFLLALWKQVSSWL